MTPTPEQLEQMRHDQREWQAQPLPPCGIPHDDPYNPCMPERDDFRGLWCALCGRELKTS
jgi:hypothetical protein